MSFTFRGRVSAVPPAGIATRESAGSVVVDGVRVQSLTADELVERTLGLLRAPGTHVLVGVNAHVVNLARRDAALRRFLAETDVNYADGQSVVWAATLLGGRLPARLATTDVALPILEAAARTGVAVYFFGARPGVAAAAAERIRARVPGIRLRSHHGYVDEAGTSELLRDIREHGTGILFVGLGDPLQEEWIERHRDALPTVVLTCGGLFDWLSGTHRRAPQWMIRAGLEWLWRLAIEPRRLARRYLVGNPSFVAAVLRQWRAEHIGAPTRLHGGTP